ncbi:Asp23/Gls24 family envelope stress response protein [Brevibacillus sp. H7]|jgi:uncharacterized alkaline shock family protein YloU|uniref:Asp23/Gls24 family envelope stress response protein n=1 Tax=Brevibacillus sp. H7 TaxID=3349138 RepID=UPI0038144C5C
MDDRRGEIRVADQVVAVIASIVTEEVQGISIKGGLYQDLAKKIGGGARGISVAISEGQIVIDMRVTVTYGMHIHQVCTELQEKVKETVEMLTGLKVEAVNVRVEGIDIKNSERPAQ